MVSLQNPSAMIIGLPESTIEALYKNIKLKTPVDMDDWFNRFLIENLDPCPESMVQRQRGLGLPRWMHLILELPLKLLQLDKFHY